LFGFAYEKATLFFLLNANSVAVGMRDEYAVSQDGMKGMEKAGKDSASCSLQHE
jgi:hypothetical protein